MPAITAVSPFPDHRAVAMPQLLGVGYMAAVLDLLAATAYWTPHGVSPWRIPQSIAAWLLGPPAYAGGILTAAFGVLLYGQVLWGVAAAYRAIARRHRLLLRRPFLCGALYGMAAYVAIFQVLVPLLFGVHQVASAPWTMTCLLAYAAVVGIPCALGARASYGPTRRT
jgi:hypothetical protein